MLPLFFSQAARRSYCCVWVAEPSRLSAKIDVEHENRVVDVVSVDIHARLLLWKVTIPPQKRTTAGSPSQPLSACHKWFLWICSCYVLMSRCHYFSWSCKVRLSLIRFIGSLHAIAMLRKTEGDVPFKLTAFLLLQMCVTTDKLLHNKPAVTKGCQCVSGSPPYAHHSMFLWFRQRKERQGEKGSNQRLCTFRELLSSVKGSRSGVWCG